MCPATHVNEIGSLLSSFSLILGLYGRSYYREWTAASSNKEKPEDDAPDETAMGQIYSLLIFLTLVQLQLSIYGVSVRFHVSEEVCLVWSPQQ